MFAGKESGLGRYNKMTDNFKKVSKDEFYKSMDRDVVVEAIGPYPFKCEFRLRNRFLVGYTVGYAYEDYGKPEDDYFLRESEILK